MAQARQKANPIRRQVASRAPAKKKTTPHLAYLFCIFAALALGFSLGRLHIKRSTTVQLEQEQNDLRVEFAESKKQMENEYIKEAEQIKRNADLALKKADEFYEKAATLSSQVLAKTYQKRGLTRIEYFLASGNGRAIRKARIVGERTIRVVFGNDARSVRPSVTIDFYDQNGFRIGSCSRTWIFDEIYAGGRYPEQLTVSGALGLSHAKYVKTQDESTMRRRDR